MGAFLALWTCPGQVSGGAFGPPKLLQWLYRRLRRPSSVPARQVGGLGRLREAEGQGLRARKALEGGGARERGAKNNRRSNLASNMGGSGNEVRPGRPRALKQRTSNGREKGQVGSQPASATLIARLMRGRSLLLGLDHVDHRVAAIAKRVGLSRSRFITEYRRLFGETPHQPLIRSRLTVAVTLLEAGQSVTDVCLAVGFSSVGSFSALFHRRMGRPPSSVCGAAQPFPMCITLMNQAFGKI